VTSIPLSTQAARGTERETREREKEERERGGREEGGRREERRERREERGERERIMVDTPFSSLELEHFSDG